MRGRVGQAGAWGVLDRLRVVEEVGLWEAVACGAGGAC